MAEIGDRLRQRRIAAGFKTASDAARRYGWNENTYRSHENTTRNVPRKWLLSYAKAYGVTLSWLTTGTEESLSAASNAGQVIPVVSWDQLPRTRPMSVKSLTKATPDAAKIVWSRKIAIEPVAVPVLDDSMVHEDDPKKSLYPRDEVVVDLKGTPKPGSVVLVFDREAQEHVLRRIEFPTRGTARCVAYNHAYPSFELPANSDHILGVVVALQRELS